MSKRERAIHRRDFDTSIAERLDYKTRQETAILEDYAKEVYDLNKLALGWSEDYTEVINMEDELSSIKADFIAAPGFKTTLGGTPITFTKAGKIYKPELSGVEIKGRLKHKLVMHLTKGVDPKIVSLNGTPAVKYVIQYSTYALEVYVFKNGNSFFKAYFSAKKDRPKQTNHYQKRLVVEVEDSIDGSMFPDMELQAVEDALLLVDELEALAKKSPAVAKILMDRDIATYAEQIGELESRVAELEDEIEDLQMI